MKNSINKILKNISLYLLIITLSIGLVLFLTLEENNSYAKVKNLEEQKAILTLLVNMQTDDLELAMIQLNGKNAQLQFDIEKLHKLDEYNYIGQYILKDTDSYKADLGKLSILSTTFEKSANSYYNEKGKLIEKKLTKKEKILKFEVEKLKEQELKNNYYTLTKFIDSMIFKNIKYSEGKFNILQDVVIFTFAISVLAMLWYRRRITSIYNDILFLYSVGQSKKDYDVFSIEADAIRLRMNKKAVISDNPDMLDPVTQLNNKKGMINSFTQKKALHENLTTSVTVFEIDNFSKSNRAFSQEFVQTVLKKIAFTMSLHENSSDVLARTDYNQFTLIFARDSKEAALRDINIIRQTISEIQFRTSDTSSAITVSGGFTIKENNKSVEESLHKAKEALAQAKNNGTNTIVQVRDMAKR